MKRLNRYEAWYIEQMNNIIENGQRRGDRTGTGVISMPNLHYTHDLRESHPIMSTREFVFDQPITEMIWMMSGDSNIQYLKDNGCPFWNHFAVKEGQETPMELNRVERLKLLANRRGVPVSQVMTIFATQPLSEIDYELDRQEIPNMINAATGKVGELGPVYGVQWRNWPNPDGTTFDQLSYALETLRNDPDSRRVVVDCWNPSYLPDPKQSPAANAALGKMALTPCHFTFGFYTWEIPFHERCELLKKACTQSEWMSFYPVYKNSDTIEKVDALLNKYEIPKHYLDISFIMRSNDWLLGQPANMNMYSALLMMFANELGMEPRFVNYTGWDCHVYTNHLEGAAEINKRWATGDHKFVAHEVALLPKGTRKGLFNYHKSDFSILGYSPEGKIKFPIAI